MFELFEDRALPTAVSILPVPPAVTEGGNGSFDITRDDNTGFLTVNISVSGTATASSDYNPLPPSVTFNPGESTYHLGVITTDDSTSEATETIVVTLTSGTGYTVGS